MASVNYILGLPVTVQGRLGLIANESAQGMDYLARVMPQYTDTILTAAQVLALSVTPITLVPAPSGAGLANVFQGAYMAMVYGGTAYAAGGAVNITWQNTSGSTAGTVPATFVTSAVTSYSQVGLGASPVFQVNQPLVVYNATAAFTTGNSLIQIRCFYQVVQATEIGVSG